MTDNRLDDEIKKMLLNRTEEIKELQDPIWNKIEAEISSKDNIIKLTPEKNRLKIPLIRNLLGIAAVILFILIMGNSKPGTIVIGKAKAMLVPQKKVIQSIEGIENQQEVTLKESTVGYTLYIDDSRFNIEKLGSKDKITPKIKPSDSSLPEMYMEISQVADKTPDELITEVENQLKVDFKNVSPAEKVQTPIEGNKISAHTGIKRNDTRVVYYFLDNKHGGSFIIKEQYFIEAEEGIGARFDNMLKDFKVSE